MAVVADMWGMHGDVGTGWWIVMTLGMVLFWGSVIALVVWVVRGGGARAAEDPKAILDRRLASGEITPEEYEQRRNMLGGAPVSG